MRFTRRFSTQFTHVTLASALLIGVVVSATLAESNRRVSTASPPVEQAASATQPTAATSEMQGGQRQIQVIRLKHVSAEEAVRSINALVIPPVRVAGTSAGNSIVVSGTPGDIMRVKAIVEPLDVADDAARRVTKTYALKSADPEEVCPVIESLETKPICVPVSFTRSVVITAGADQFKPIEDLLQAVDQPKPADKDRMLQIFAVHRRLSPNLLDAVKLALGMDGEFSTDPVTNSIILMSSAQGAASVQQVLKFLDQKTNPAPEPGGQTSLRLVWLTAPRQRGGTLTGAAEATAVPADLAPVVEELEAMGIRGLSLAAQAIVAVDESEFKLSAVPRLNNNGEELSCSREVEGTLETSQAGNVPRVSLSIRLQISDTFTSNIETTVRAPFNHPVALATAPVANLHSVLIVELRQAGR